jgi:hypothetical protein
MDATLERSSAQILILMEPVSNANMHFATLKDNACLALILKEE